MRIRERHPRQFFKPCPLTEGVDLEKHMLAVRRHDQINRAVMEIIAIGDGAAFLGNALGQVMSGYELLRVCRSRLWRQISGSDCGI